MMLMEQIISSLEVLDKGCLLFVMYFRTRVVTRHTEGLNTGKSLEQQSGVPNLKVHSMGET